MISEAHTDVQRQKVLRLFLDHFKDIDPNAVPMTSADYLYAPTVLQYHDADTGRLVGAALSCRAQIAVATIMGTRMGLPDRGYGRVLDMHRELDLVCVAPDFRGRGIGGQLLDFMERRLRERGVRVWFGNVTSDLDVDRLRHFYASHGFTVLAPGQPLPPLLGKTWTMPGTPPPAFFFYKALKRAV